MKKQLGCEKISKISAEKVKIKPMFKDTKYKFVPSSEGPTGTLGEPQTISPIGTCGNYDFESARLNQLDSGLIFLSQNDINENLTQEINE